MISDSGDRLFLELRNAIISVSRSRDEASLGLALSLLKQVEDMCESFEESAYGEDL